ncbi:hypothetical protein ACIQUB_25040 [Rhizobium sp. NPDC090275]|uniref:hypothetical protein n=1 Tax=Rhizobium sp. NPDC090275 TaxID=3364498 RepID=UPI00383A8332
MIPVVLAAAILLASLQATTPPYATLTGPIGTVGRQSETVSSNTFSVKVNRVLKAKNIGYEQFGRAASLGSSGVWVVISAELQAFQKTMPVRAATLVGASGRMYRQSRRAGDAPNILSAKIAQPGLPTNGLFVFELPEDEISNMKLVLSEQYDPQLKDEISVLLQPDDTAPQARLEIRKDGV